MNIFCLSYVSIVIEYEYDMQHKLDTTGNCSQNVSLYKLMNSTEEI